MRLWMNISNYESTPKSLFSPQSDTLSLPMWHKASKFH
jgi:hypothetical protein